MSGIVKLSSLLMIGLPCLGVIAPITPADGNHGTICQQYSSGGSITTSPISMVGANILFMVIEGSSPTASNISDSAGNTWKVFSPSVSSTEAKTTLAYAPFASVTATQTFTVNLVVSVCVLGVSGVRTLSDPADTGYAGAFTNTGVLTQAMPSYTPNFANEIIITGLTWYPNPSGTVSINGGFTLAGSANSLTEPGVAIAYQIQTTATAIAPTWSKTGSGTFPAGVIVAFQAQPAPVAYSGVEPRAASIAGGGINISSVPTQASGAGYSTLAFSSTLEPYEFDLAQSYPSALSQPRLKWYYYRFFADGPQAVNTVGFTPGQPTTIGAGNNFTTIGTAGYVTGSYVGTVFSGGFYAEASLAWNHAQVVAAAGSGGWPAWWTMAIEHLDESNADQWPGQSTSPVFRHFSEVDFMEDDVWSFSPLGSYGATMHDWFGESSNQVSNAVGGGSNFGNFVVNTGTTTNLSQFHKYGMLWVPATVSSNGYVSNYFDDQLMSTVTWSQYSCLAGTPIPSLVSPTMPGTNNATFGITDCDHFPLLLETGNTQPVQVQYVRVFCASEDCVTIK